MTKKLFATSMAAAAIVCGAAAGMTSLASSTLVAAPATQLVVFGAPMPLDPADAVPTADQLSSVLYGLADPSVSFSSKGYLVEGGIGIIEGRAADGMMKNAVAKGMMPLSFSIGNIAPAGPGAATATVTASGPTLAPTSQSITFVDQGSWKLSRSSATQVMSMLSA
jgi:hypothetical protein